MFKPLDVVAFAFLLTVDPGKPSWYTNPEWWLCLIGFGTLVFVMIQTLATRKAAQAAENSITLAQRPVIMVRNFYFTEMHSGPRIRSGVYSGSQASGQFYVANHGGTDAIVEEIFCEAKIMKEPLPMMRPYEGLIGRKYDHRIGAGGSFPIVFAKRPPISEYEMAELNEPQACQFFFVFGWVGYRDRLGNYMKTNFCRKYVKSSNRFEPIDDPDYEDEYKRASD